MNQMQESRRKPTLELTEDLRERYERIRNYREQYGISPFEDKDVKNRSPELYRAAIRMRRKTKRKGME